MHPHRHGLPPRRLTWLWYSRMKLLDHGPRFTNRLTLQIEASILPYRKRLKFPHGHYERQSHYLGHRGRHLSRSYTCSMSFRIASCPPNAHAIIRHREREKNLNRESRKGRKREGVRERERVRLLRHVFAYHAYKLTLARITAYTLAHNRILLTQVITLRVTHNTLYWHYRSPLKHTLLYE